MQSKLDRFLLTYRATPTTLGKSPFELLMNRQPIIRLSALRTKSSKLEVKVFEDNLDSKPQFTPTKQFLCVMLAKEPNGFQESLLEQSVPGILRLGSETLSGSDIKNNYVHDSYLPH